MTVNPSPVLELNYFMQRDVLGDDPLTQDVIEPCLDAEFSLLVNNKGYGDANKLQFSTNTPEITANEKGIDWKFRMTEARLNGETAAMPLGGSSVVDFGNIPAHGYAYAQWFFKSSLLGHFTSYDISATHLSSHGNPDLSLIDTVSIHELTRSIQPSWSDEKGIAFLVNDIADSEDTPDALYLTDGSVENVAKARNLQVKMHQPETVVITMAPSAAGWNYGSLADPTGGQAQLVKVTRTDGTQIPLRNCWQTDRTLRDGKEPLYENLIHLVDECSSSDEVTYVLEFKPREDAYALEWNMKEGWNWVSSSLSQPIDIIGNFDNLERVQSQTSELVSDPVMGFTGNVTKMLPGLGYKIKVSRDCTTSVNGYKLDNTTPVTYMKKGWNWIGYPLCFRAGIDNLIGNAEEGDVITSQEGFTLFGEGRWDGSLKTLEAGKGYMYKSSSEKPLHFNMVEESGQTRDMADRNVPASRDVDIHKYPCTMNLVARVEGKGHTQSEDECTIFAMTGNECRGMSERIGDYYYITIYGEKAAEISFVVENHTTGTASLADNTIVFMEEVVGNRVSPYIISVTDYTGVQALSHEDKGMDIYAIDGMLVRKNASSSSIKSLPRGIYVIHGKKYAIW